MKYIIFIGSLAVILCVALLLLDLKVHSKPSAIGSETGGYESYSCASTTIGQVTVGNQLSSNILSIHGNRAWARIQQPANATNTVTISENFGNAAVVGSGMQLTPATTTSPVPYHDLGLNTDDPYIGTTTAITSTGSSTLLITECLY